jgi:transposase
VTWHDLKFKKGPSPVPQKVDSAFRIWEKGIMDQDVGSKSKPRRQFSEEFRRSVVDHLKTSDKTIVQVAADFGVSPENLRKWKHRYGSQAKPTDAPLPRTPEELIREVQELRTELARVRMQRDILKKTIGIVSEASDKDIT